MILAEADAAAEDVLEQPALLPRAPELELGVAAGVEGDVDAPPADAARDGRHDRPVAAVEAVREPQQRRADVDDAPRRRGQRRVRRVLRPRPREVNRASARALCRAAPHLPRR